jgi:signal transduction histidine kinase
MDAPPKPADGAGNPDLASDNALGKATELRLSAFAALGRSLSGAKDSKAAAEIIMEAADQLLGWDACICHLYSASENLLFPILTKDIINGRRAESAIVRTTLKPAGPVLRAIQEGGQLVLREPPAMLATDTMPFGDKSRPSASILWVPVRKGEEVIGLLSIQSYTYHAYNRQSLETLQALADHCSGALDRIRSEEALRRTEEQLRQSQKMEAIGLLAGGVAHDFNNLLTIILGNAEVALENAARGEPPGTDNLEQIVEAANRAGKLTRQLLAFSRKQVMSPKPLDLNQLVNQLGQMLRRIIGQDIHLHCTCAPALPLVQADVGMIDQAVMNLVVNARDAMKTGGEVEITTEVVDIDSMQLHRRREAHVGRFVCLSVKDQGTGIAPEDLTRIFEPFFTTKGIGKGTGLGLSTVFGIVKQHQGWLEVESKLGVGSIFRIFLPALPPAPIAAAGAPDKPASSDGREVILFAEDEMEVRQITCLILGMAGYRVLAAGSGPEALEIWSRHAGEIDLLLSDILMPGGMDGRELAQRLSAAKPTLKIILLSGFTGDLPGAKAGQAPRVCHRFLQKPCARKDLLQAIREVLDEKPAR